MRRIAAFVAVALLALAALAADERIDEARRLSQANDPAAAAAWERVIAELPDDAVVTIGDAHWFAAEGHRAADDADAAIRVMQDFLKEYGKTSPGTFRARRGLFFDYVAAGLHSDAQKAGKALLKDHADANGCYGVLAAFFEHDWAPPKALRTSYETLRAWTFDRTDGSRDPDRRLWFLELLERHHPKQTGVKEGTPLYTKGWAHQQAGRHEDAIKLFRRYLSKHRDGRLEQRVRFALADSLLARDPPDDKAATRELEKVIALGGKMAERAQRRLQDVAAGAGSAAELAVKDGLPSEDGLGTVVVLSAFSARSAEGQALQPLVEHHEADIVKLDVADVAGAATRLRKRGPEFVIVAVPPDVIDINFHLSVLELCRNLDEDPLPDFHFGYVIGRDAVDLAMFAERLVARHRAPIAKPRLDVIALDAGGAQRLGSLDAALHFGHGTPWGVNGGLKGEEVGLLPLSHAPVVFSGACFNGVCGRSYHPSQLQPIHLNPATISPDRLMTLNWVHAGVSGYLAALEADRGEMAMAEWSRMRQRAEPLGAVIGHQYRIVFTSLPAGFTKFRRYRNRYKKDMSFYRVMLRGAVSRLLIGDPSLRPFGVPVDDPAQQHSWAQAADGEATLSARVLRFDQGTSQCYMPTSGKDAFAHRLYVRAAVPEDVAESLGAPSFHVTMGDAEIPTDAIRVYDEVWGGDRYVNVIVESTDRRLASAGAALTCTFATDR